MTTRFYDRHERRSYLKACEVARRIVTDPALIEDGQRFLERAMAPAPHQSQYVAMWREMLTQPAAEIAAALIEDSPRGSLLRDTSPVFGPGFTSREIVALMDRADAPAV